MLVSKSRSATVSRRNYILGLECEINTRAHGSKFKKPTLQVMPSSSQGTMRPILSIERASSRFPPPEKPIRPPAVVRQSAQKAVTISGIIAALGKKNRGFSWRKYTPSPPPLTPRPPSSGGKAELAKRREWRFLLEKNYMPRVTFPPNRAELVQHDEQCRQVTSKITPLDARRQSNDDYAQTADASGANGASVPNGGCVGSSISPLRTRHLTGTAGIRHPCQDLWPAP